MKNINLQDTFLNKARKDKISVTVFLVNGFQFKGMVRGFDNFTINLVDNDFLDFKAPTPQHFGYCVFGEVVEGMDVVDQIAAVKTGSHQMHRDVPTENIVILDAVRD